jgi:hypothetical protein
MAEIFSMANHVYAWLGEGDEETKLAFNWSRNGPPIWIRRGYSALSVEKSAISVENRASGRRRPHREPDDRALSIGQVSLRAAAKTSALAGPL